MSKYSLDDIKTGGHSHDPPVVVRRKKTGNLKEMRFCSTHHHTTYSYDDGYQLPEAHVRRAEELQMPAVFFTEHGNISSHVKAEKAAEQSGVKVGFGCEVYTGQVGPNATQRKYHLTILAADAEGYRNLIQLVTRSWREGFYYEPTVSWRMLLEHRRGLVLLSGCQGSLLFCSAVGGKLIPEDEASERRAIDVAKRFEQAFGDSYYIEVQAFPELEKTRRFNEMAPRIAAACGRPLVATMDVHYTQLEEQEVQKILHNARPGSQGTTLEEQVRDWGYEAPLCPPENDATIYQRLRASGLGKGDAIQAIASTEEIAQRCNVVLPKLPMVRFPLPAGYDDVTDLWLDWLRDGWRFRKCDELPPDVRARYRRQLKHEREIIESKGFLDYFLIVSDLVKFAKDEGVPVGPGRGSAAASLVCWLLRITEVNPMEFPQLVFERFIDWTREDLPDIDLDFPGESRPMIREYAVGRYGRECVNNLGTRTMYKAKLALDTVGRVHGIPFAAVETVKELLVERSSGDLRASATIEDTIEQFDRAREVAEEYPDIRKATLLEGNAKGEGVHAAGLVISDGPITDVCSFMVREVPKGSGRMIEVVTHDKYDAERQGLLKIDLLALNTMSMLWAACREIGMDPQDLYSLPLDDAKTIRGFQRNDVVGVFQFDGRATRYVSGAVMPDTFAEVCDCGALSRPGPLHNGAARTYAAIKHGEVRAELPHPSLGPILEQTKGQIVYQEQILRICREVGNFDWTHAAHIRTIISRKYGEAAFNKEWGRFLEGTRTLHERTDYPPMSAITAKAIWGDMITSGSYAFNAAHCVCYGLIGYWTMWFKQHHPAVFYAAALEHLGEGKPEKQHDLLRDAVKGESKGRTPTVVLPPHPARSRVSWRPARRRSAVRAGYRQIDGVGAKTADLFAARKLSTWADAQSIPGVGEKTVEKIEAFVAGDDPFGIFKIDRDVEKVTAELDELGLPQPTHRAVDLRQGDTGRVVWLGTAFLRNVRDMFEMNRIKKGEELDRREVKDPHLNEFCLMRCEDETDQLLVKVDRWKYPAYRQGLFDMRLREDLMLVEGYRPPYASGRQINVKRLWVIDPE